MSEAEIVARRRKWSAEEKAALLAEVEAEGGRVSVVARRHGLSDSLLYNWRSAWKAAMSMRPAEPVEFLPLAGCATSCEPRLPGCWMYCMLLPWFRESMRQRWRDGIKFVPADWLR